MARPSGAEPSCGSPGMAQYRDRACRLAWSRLAARARDDKRVVRHARLAAASQLTTPSGPILAASLQPGMEVWGVSHAGQLARIKITAFLPADDPVPLVRVLTRAGDLLVPPDAYVASFNGPIAAGELRP